MADSIVLYDFRKAGIDSNHSMWVTSNFPEDSDKFGSSIYFKIHRQDQIAGIALSRKQVHALINAMLNYLEDTDDKEF